MLTFTSKDILNSTICIHGGQVAYTLHTTKDIRGRKVTTVAGSTPASINWQKHYLEVGTQVLPVGEAKREAGDRLNSEKVWQWGDAEYDLHFSQDRWTAKKLSGVVVAFFFPYHTRTFHKSELAQVVLQNDLPPAEATFLVLVFIYSEIRRQDEQRASSAGTSAEAASSAATSAGGVLRVPLFGLQ